MACDVSPVAMFFQDLPVLSLCKISDLTVQPFRFFVKKSDIFLSYLWKKDLSCKIFTVLHQSKTNLSDFDQKLAKNKAITFQDFFYSYFHSLTHKCIDPLIDPLASLTSKLSASRATTSKSWDMSGQPWLAVLIPPLKQEYLSAHHCTGRGKQMAVGYTSGSGDIFTNWHLFVFACEYLAIYCPSPTYVEP